jgi:hypothetical protein
MESVLALSDGAADARQMPGKLGPRNLTVLMASLAPELIPLEIPFEMGFPPALMIPA